MSNESSSAASVEETRPSDLATTPRKDGRITGERDTAEVLQLAVQHHQAGRLDDADGLYRLLLETNPEMPDALHLSGLLALDRGSSKKAVKMIRRAIEHDPDNGAYHINLARALVALGETDEALTAYGRGIDLDPASASAHAGLGILLRDMDRTDEAIESLRRARASEPNSAEIETTLGTVLHAAGQYDEALACHRRALEIKPDLAAAHANLGLTLFELGKTTEAIEHSRKAVELQPRAAAAHLNLGWALFAIGERKEAKEHFARALELNDDSSEARLKMGLALLAEHGREEANKHFKRAAQLPRAAHRQCAFFKLRHDIDQLRHLYARGLVGKEVQAIIGRYESVRDSLSDRLDPDEIFTLDDEQRAKLGTTYAGTYFLPDCPEVSGQALSSSWDRSVQKAYLNSNPNVVVVDDFLTKEALSGLRAFCREATIWHDVKHGYLGAYLKDGFGAPLVLQIADELRKRMPNVLKEHPLIEAWAYKYDQELRGIETHADCAAVNVNFWIAPDDANCDPDSGGIVVYKAQAPLDWDFHRYNSDTAAIEEFLDEAGREEVKIAHRANRAVIFNSNLFHKTDAFDFRSGYINRRVNITMLFGHRSNR